MEPGDTQNIVRHECTCCHISVRNCTKDEGRPLGAGLQEQASNHLKLLWSKARVVSVEEKSRPKTAAGMTQGDERKRTIR